MAQLVFAEAGRALGAALLPNALSVGGLSVSGAALGQAIGSVAGRAIDNALAGPIGETGRIDGLTIMESREGVGIPRVYGRARIGGQVIWATHLKERSKNRRVGGKGGPTVTDYSYTISFAVALCEGEVSGVERVWANGQLISLATLNWRFYSGSETQLPDPLIEAVEGASPAYRGLAYIVFEDFALDDYGARLPQLSFQVVRPVRGAGRKLADVVTGVNFIPASGEWVYSPDLIRRIEYPGWEETLNQHSGSGEVDVHQSLDQLQAELPNVHSVNVTLAWFGDDLRAGVCTVKPGVETREQINLPRDWKAGGRNRENAHLISRDENNRSFYGGSPDDKSVLALFDEMAARGLSITVSPFLLMDVPAGNDLPDPYGAAEQAAFPWRGRVTAMVDQTAQTRMDVDHFFGAAAASDFALNGQTISYSGPSEWSYRRFVLHLAMLVKASGKVSRFLLGSELRGLTRLRDQNGDFPAVEQLISLAGEVRSILGAGVEISYAADWTEYGAYHPADSNGDVLFPLDALWADSNIDFIGLDWYAPLSDWRDGDHLDGEIYETITDPAYLAANIQGGEGYDWYYASEADRHSQTRTPIHDTAYGEDWVFRVKDLTNWWSSAHHARPGGVRAVGATPWVPESKPIHLIEIGCGAVDKGTNAPNVFVDPKSDESGLPPYSNGRRDDELQAAAILALADYWAVSAGNNPISSVYAAPMIPADGLSVWCFDARPYPAFPSRQDVWSDGANWSTGHWLNGRLTHSSVAAIVEDVFAAAGISGEPLSVQGQVPGFVSTGIVTVRDVLEPLATAFSLSCRQAEDGLEVFNTGLRSVQSVTNAEMALERRQTRAHSFLRKVTEHAPHSVRLTFADIDTEHRAASVRFGADDAGDRDLHVQLPFALDTGNAEKLAEDLFTRVNAQQVSEALTLSPERSDLKVGDFVTIEGSETEQRVQTLTRQGAISLALDKPTAGFLGGFYVPETSGIPSHSPRPDLVVLDLPGLPGAPDDTRPLVGAFAYPWPGQVTVSAGRNETALSSRAVLTRPSMIGRLSGTLNGGASDRFRPGTAVDIIFPDAELSSAARTDVLNGANLIAIETVSGWMLAAFETAEQVASDTWRVSDLLTGLYGTDDGAAVGASDGARVVVIDQALERASVFEDEIGLAMIWQAAGPGALGDTASETLTLNGRALLPFRPGHLKAVRNASGDLDVSWTRRSRHSGDNWDQSSVPLFEEAELYLLEVFKENSLVRSEQITQPGWVYRAADQLIDGTNAGPLKIAVSQISAMTGSGVRAILAVLA